MVTLIMVALFPIVTKTAAPPAGFRLITWGRLVPEDGGSKPALRLDWGLCVTVSFQWRSRCHSMVSIVPLAAGKLVLRCHPTPCCWRVRPGLECLSRRAHPVGLMSLDARSRIGTCVMRDLLRSKRALERSTSSNTT